MNDESDRYGMTKEEFARTKLFLYVQALKGDQESCANMLDFLTRKIDLHERLDGLDQGALIVVLSRIRQDSRAVGVASGAGTKRGHPKTGAKSLQTALDVYRAHVLDKLSAEAAWQEVAEQHNCLFAPESDPLAPGICI